MNFLVIGCGSIGQRHIRNLKSLGYEVCGCEKDCIRTGDVQKKYGIEMFSDLDSALSKKYTAAFICTPTSFHISTAIWVAKKGIHLFIEKPLSNSLKNIEILSKIIKTNKLVSLIGCNTRFFPSFITTKKLINNNAIGKIMSVRIECGFYLPYWHPYEDYRKGYSANKKLGGGVIFDDIHELDSLHWLFGEVKEVFCFIDKISNLDINTEDIAEIFIRFKTRVIAQIHLDYLQRTYRRNYEFIGENGIIIWDYISQKVELFGKKTNQKKVFHESINTNREIMFINEIKHFINCIQRTEQSINDIYMATDVLKIALACYDSARKKEIVYL